MTAETDIPFQLFGAPHLVVIATAVGLPALLSVIVRARPGTSMFVCIALSAILVLNDVIYRVYAFMEYGSEKFVADHLPIHICGVAIYVMPFMLLMRRQIAFEIIWFWGIAGTAQAVVTPDLSYGFPTYIFNRFFIAHAGIVVAALFATWGLGMRPAKGAILRVFMLSNVFMAAVAGFNYLAGANYMYLCQPPGGDSPMFFLPWPWYILFLEAVGLASFTILYLPFIAGRSGKTDKSPETI